jgi:hypothetical protein
MSPSLGRQYHFAKHNAEALPWLLLAIKQPTNLYPLTKLYALTHASIAAGESDLTAAPALAVQMYSFLKAYGPGVSPTVRSVQWVKFFGELVLRSHPRLRCTER